MNTNNNYSLEKWPLEHVDGGAGAPAVNTLLGANIVLIACGSLGCIRSIYMDCEKSGYRDRFVPLIINDREYALGKNEEILRAGISKVLREKDVDAVVLYISCCEVLMSTDFEGIAKRVDNPKNIPVIPYFRGPLCNRRINMRQIAKDIAASLPKASKKQKGLALPTPAADFDGINLVAHDFGYGRVLYTPGGCAGGMTEHEGLSINIKTRFNDIFASRGVFDDINASIGEAAEKDKDYVILKTAVPSIIMNGTEDYSMIADDEHLHMGNTNAWKTASRGISDFLLSELKRYIKGLSVKENSLNILGYSYISCSDKSSLDKALSEYSKGFGTADYWHPKQGYIASENLVISYEGLACAKYLEKEYSIPYKMERPLTAQQKKKFLDSIADVKGTLCLTGDPVLIYTLEKIAREASFEYEIKKLVYMPLKDESIIVRRSLDNSFIVCASDEELYENVKGCSLFAGDSCYYDWLKDLDERCSFFEIPYHLIGTK